MVWETETSRPLRYWQILYVVFWLTNVSFLIRLPCDELQDESKFKKLEAFCELACLSLHPGLLLEGLITVTHNTNEKRFHRI